MAQFLDTNGLKTLINEIKTFVNNKFSKCLTGWSIETNLRNEKIINFAETATKEGEVYFYLDKDNNGYVQGNVYGWDNKVNKEGFTTTLGVKAGDFPGLTQNNYVSQDANITNAIDELDMALKKVDNKINNSGGSVDLTDVNDKISKLEGGVKSLNTKSDVNDNAHELYNELMIFNNLLETQDFSNNWKMYDYNGESYDFIDTGDEYNGLKIYKENIENENYITHIESSQVFNVYKPGKYILYFYSQFNPQLDNVELKAKACIYSEGSVYDEGSVCCEGKSVIIPINRNGYDLIKLQFEITQDDLDNIVDYINHIRIIIDNGSDENSTGIPLGVHNLMITPFVLYGKNQNQDLNEVLEPITSSIDTLTAKVSTNSVAINEQKEMIDNIKGSCCKLIHLNMDFSTGSGNLTVDDLNNINNTEYPNIIAHISGSYDPAKAQGVNLTGGDEVLYKFETVTYINKLDDSAVAHVQGCLTDMAGGFPGIYSYYININLKEIGETPAGYWNVTNGGVKMF